MIAVAAIEINRAPVLTLWATIVARRAGLSNDEALSIGRAVAGLTAQSKGRRLGVYKQASESEAERVRRARSDLDARSLHFMHRSIPIVRHDGQIRALAKDKPIDPDTVRRYLDSKFGAALPVFQEKLTTLGDAFPIDVLLTEAMDLYARFRPTVPAGVEGWGKKALFDTRAIDAVMPTD